MLKEDCNIFSEITKIYQYRITHLRSYLKHLKNTPFEYQSNEKYVYGSENKFLEATSLDDYWKKRMKLYVLNSYCEQFDSLPKQVPLTFNKK